MTCRLLRLACLVVLVGCGGSTQGVEPTTAAATPTSRDWPDFQLAAGEPLVPAEYCPLQANAPTWSLDKAGHTASVGGTVPRATLPPSWTVTEERPDLLVLRAPETRDGVQPVMELFLAALCTPDVKGISYRRSVMRGLIDLQPPADTERALDAVNSGEGPGGAAARFELGAPGMSFHMLDMPVPTRAGPRTLDAVGTMILSAGGSALYASVVCVADGNREGPRSPCLEAYEAVVASVLASIEAQ